MVSRSWPRNQKRLPRLRKPRMDGYETQKPRGVAKASNQLTSQSFSIQLQRDEVARSNRPDASSSSRPFPQAWCSSVLPCTSFIDRLLSSYWTAVLVTIVIYLYHRSQKYAGAHVEDSDWVRGGCPENCWTAARAQDSGDTQRGSGNRDFQYRKLNLFDHNGDLPISADAIEAALGMQQRRGYPAQVLIPALPAPHIATNRFYNGEGRFNRGWCCPTFLAGSIPHAADEPLRSLPGLRLDCEQRSGCDASIHGTADPECDGPP